ncbi:transposase [Streptomyces sp. SID8382]|nr:transposase [Streptomyces sp. SID8382]
MFLPVSNGRCGRWRDHRQVIDGILHRVRTGDQWRIPPEWFGLWKIVGADKSSVQFTPRAGICGGFRRAGLVCGLPDERAGLVG